MWPHHPRTHRIREMLDRRRRSARSGGCRGVHLPDGPARPAEHPPPPGPGRRQPARRRLLPGRRDPLGDRGRAGPGVRRGPGTPTAWTSRSAACSAFPGDRAAAFDCGFTLPYRAWLEVVGTGGTIRVPRMWAPAPAGDVGGRGERPAGRRARGRGGGPDRPDARRVRRRRVGGPGPAAGAGRGGQDAAGAGRPRGGRSPRAERSRCDRRSRHVLGPPAIPAADELVPGRRSASPCVVIPTRQWVHVWFSTAAKASAPWAFTSRSYCPRIAGGIFASSAASAAVARLHLVLESHHPLGRLLLVGREVGLRLGHRRLELGNLRRPLVHVGHGGEQVVLLFGDRTPSCWRCRAPWPRSAGGRSGCRAASRAWPGPG